jgi:hypothetical protein
MGDDRRMQHVGDERDNMMVRRESNVGYWDREVDT